MCAVENAAAPSKYSYWTIQSLFQLYQGLLKSNPILTKSLTSGVIACAGSSLSQVKFVSRYNKQLDKFYVHQCQTQKTL